MTRTPPSDDDARADEVALYLKETRALLMQANDLLAEHDSQVHVDALLRVFHTIKGTAGFFFFTKTRVLAHAVEELLVGVRDRGWQLDAGKYNALQASIDTLTMLTSCIAKDSNEDAVDTSGSWAQLNSVIEAAKNQVAAAQPPVRASRTSVAKPASGRAQNEMKGASRKPIGPLFRQLERFASALASDLEKRVDFQFDVPEISMSGDFLIALRQCFIQLIRNSLAHGIELPGERQALGKTPAGILQLRSERQLGLANQDAFWLFEYADDGGGVDVAKIRALAVSQGLIAADAARDADDADVLQWMWLPGVSTVPDATDVAGRGVGLDFVQETTRGLGGEVAVMSQAGQGTRFSLRFPESVCLGQIRDDDEL